MDAEIIKMLTGLGQAAIFAWAAYQFYRDGRAQDKVFIAHLQEQNKMLFAWIQQITFLKSPAISPAIPPSVPVAPWMGNIPTDIGEKVGV